MHHVQSHGSVFALVYTLFTEQFRQRFAVPVDYSAIAYEASTNTDVPDWMERDESESVSF